MPGINQIKKKIIDDWLEGKTLRVVLLTSDHVTDIDTQEFLDDINANEVSATGYTANGQDLNNITTDLDLTNDRVELDADDTVWNITGSLTARFYAIIDWTGDASTSPVVVIVDFGSNQTTTDGAFTIQWNSQGILQIA